eukprot:4998075-Prymnesium_polylepis.1
MCPRRGPDVAPMWCGGRALAGALGGDPPADRLYPGRHGRRRRQLGGCEGHQGQDARVLGECAARGLSAADPREAAGRGKAAPDICDRGDGRRRVVGRRRAAAKVPDAG